MATDVKSKAPYTIVKRTLTYLVHDREAVRRKAHEVASDQDEALREADVLAGVMKHAEYLADAEADAEADGHGDASDAWLEEVLIVADPEDDGDGYTYLSSQTTKSNEQPTEFELGLLVLGIEVGQKLVRQNADGSTDIVTVSKVTPHGAYVEGDERRYWGGDGDFPLTHSESGAALIGPADNVVPLSKILKED